MPTNPLMVWKHARIAGKAIRGFSFLAVTLMLVFMLVQVGFARGEIKPERILLDTDIGTDVDDALALVFAARSPEIELISVTTVGGRPQTRALIAKKILALLNRSDVPVASGLARPLSSNRFKQIFPEGLWLGHEGKGLLTADDLTASSFDSGPDAVNQIITILRGSKEKLTVVTIGPVSNIAAALHKDPSITDKIKRFIVMGGNVMRPPQIGESVASPLLEFNLNADREAAAVLLFSGVPVVLIPVEVTAETYLIESDVSKLRSGDPAAQALARLINIWTPILHRVYRSLNVPDASFSAMKCQLHDVVALLPLVQPKLLKFQNVDIVVQEENGMFLTKRLPKETVGSSIRKVSVPVTVATSAENNEVRQITLRRLMGR